jgi:hypothetical protein
MIFSHNKSGTVLSAMYYEPHPCSIDMEDHSELDAAGTSVVGARPVDPHRPPVQGICLLHGTLNRRQEIIPSKK